MAKNANISPQGLCTALMSQHSEDYRSVPGYYEQDHQFLPCRSNLSLILLQAV